MNQKPNLDRAAAAAFALLKAELSGEAETPDAGYFTIEQWAEKWGVCCSTARTLMRSGEKTGSAMVKRFRVQFSSRLQRVKHYKIKTERSK